MCAKWCDAVLMALAFDEEKDEAAEAKLPSNKKSRRFVLVEGLYANGGGVCPLP